VWSHSIARDEIWSGKCCDLIKKRQGSDFIIYTLNLIAQVLCQRLPVDIVLGIIFYRFPSVHPLEDLLTQ
jgi:hypothetical protein